MSKLVEKAYQEILNYLNRTPEEKLVKSFLLSEGYTEKEIIDYEFLFWYIFWIEKKLTEALLVSLKEQSKNPEDLVHESIVKELTLTGKINILRNSLEKNEKGKFKDLLAHIEKINSYRNALFHQKVKIQDILYKKKSITLKETKIKMLEDFFIINLPLINIDKTEEKIKNKLKEFKK